MLMLYLQIYLDPYISIFCFPISCLCLILHLFGFYLFPAAETVLLAFQNYILMLGTTVMIPSALVPLMGGSDVSAKFCLFVDMNFLSCSFFVFFHLLQHFVDLVSYTYPNQGDKIRAIQTLLFVSGINTLLQALFGTRLPSVVGGSFSYIIPILYIIRDSSLQRIPDPHEVSSTLLAIRANSTGYLIFLALYALASVEYKNVKIL